MPTPQVYVRKDSDPVVKLTAVTDQYRIRYQNTVFDC